MPCAHSYTQLFVGVFSSFLGKCLGEDSLAAAGGGAAYVSLTSRKTDGFLCVCFPTPTSQVLAANGFPSLWTLDSVCLSHVIHSGGCRVLPAVLTCVYLMTCSRAVAHRASPVRHAGARWGGCLLLHLWFSSPPAASPMTSTANHSPPQKTPAASQTSHL